MGLSSRFRLSLALIWRCDSFKLIQVAAGAYPGDCMTEGPGFSLASGWGHPWVLEAAHSPQPRGPLCRLFT